MASRIRILNCENVFCVYNEQKKCSLEEITIAFSGECSDCSYECLPDELRLPKYKLSRNENSSATD